MNKTAPDDSTGLDADDIPCKTNKDCPSLMFCSQGVVCRYRYLELSMETRDEPIPDAASGSDTDIGSVEIQSDRCDPNSNSPRNNKSMRRGCREKPDLLPASPETIENAEAEADPEAKAPESDDDDLDLENDPETNILGYRRSCKWYWDCEKGESCINRRCQIACLQDSDCKPGRYCDNTRCKIRRKYQRDLTGEQ